MKHEHGFKLIKKAYEIDADEKLWDLYLINFNNMNEDNFISFNDYKSKVLNEKIDLENLPKEKIEEKVKKIIDLAIKEEERWH